MPIRVDLPAPFSPTMPWIDPAPTESVMFRFAWTSRTHLSIPFSSIAGLAGLLTCCVEIRRSERRLCRRNPGGRQLFRHVVGDLDLAGHDVGAGLLEPLLHVRGDERPVVLVDRVADAALGHAERADSRFPDAFPGGVERLVHREIDAL